MTTSVRLTPRERLVLELRAHGLKNREIAEQCYISIKTVEEYVHRVSIKSGGLHGVALGFWFARQG